MADTRTSTLKIRRVAREKLGFGELRPGQEEAIRSVVGGRDTLAVMPTGGGKSAIYQIAALEKPGPTVVVSPLIALQQDQLGSLQDQELAGAAVLNSSIGVTGRREALEGLTGGDLEFLFLAPEQFNNEALLETVRAAGPSLFVIDEAHCITEWGHDFRPEYLRLGAVIEALGHPTILALTATASPTVRDEIVARLGMQNPRIIVKGFDRPNIRLEVLPCEGEEEKMRQLAYRVGKSERPGIIYTSTRKRAEDVAFQLREHGIRAVHYHAGMRPADREQVQNNFMKDEMEVIVATTAFGMGIDKPNVRFVFHYDIADSVDSYYQEIGRAGRDGQEAQAVLFYRQENLAVRKFLMSVGQVDEDVVEKVARALIAQDAPMDIKALVEKTGFSQAKLTSALSGLSDAGVIATLPTGEVRWDGPEADLTEAAQAATRVHEERREHQKLRLERIKAYAEMRDCRRRYLLEYFGEEVEGPCGRCDNCEATAEAYKAPKIQVVDESAPALAYLEADHPFPTGTRVVHREWGLGVVSRLEDGGAKVVVLFDDVGYKTLAVRIVQEHGLLERAA